MENTNMTSSNANLDCFHDSNDSIDRKLERPMEIVIRCADDLQHPDILSGIPIVISGELDLVVELATTIREMCKETDPTNGRKYIVKMLPLFALIDEDPRKIMMAGGTNRNLIDRLQLAGVGVFYKRDELQKLLTQVAAFNSIEIGQCAMPAPSAEHGVYTIDFDAPLNGLYYAPTQWPTEDDIERINGLLTNDAFLPYGEF